MIFGLVGLFVVVDLLILVGIEYWMINKLLFVINDVLFGNVMFLVKILLFSFNELIKILILFGNDVMWYINLILWSWWLIVLFWVVFGVLFCNFNGNVMLIVFEWLIWVRFKCIILELNVFYCIFLISVFFFKFFVKVMSWLLCWMVVLIFLVGIDNEIFFLLCLYNMVGIILDFCSWWFCFVLWKFCLIMFSMFVILDIFY